MNLCSYYQAHVVPAQAWFFVGILRSFEHLCFDRTLDVEKSIFEFFVPQDLEQPFLALMHLFQERGIVTEFHSLPNRLTDPQTPV